MNNGQRYGIGELALAAGITRRAVRFYVQQGLLPAPLGVGRGRHYDASHLERLQQIGRLQARGCSLEEIRRFLEGGVSTVEPAADRAALPARPARRGLAVEVRRRVRIAEGVELDFDAARVNPTVEQLLEIRRLVTAILGSEQGDADDLG